MISCNAHSPFSMTSASISSQTPAPKTNWKLQSFQTGDIFFASPDRQQRAHQDSPHLACCAPVSAELIHGLFQQASQQGLNEPVLFGLVPFDTTRNASLTVTAQPQSAAAVHGEAAIAGSSDARPRIVERHPVPAPERYGDMVRQALQAFAQGTVKKIVLSRAMDVRMDAPLQYETVLLDLLRRNAHGYTFALPIWKDGDATPQGMMLGASPELLVRREGAKVFINPLAGSIGRHADPEIDRQRREGLAISEKDLREHSYVVSDIVRVLREHCDTLEVPAGPSVIGTDALWHLSTYITGTLRDPAMTALDLACALHPTPAICGYPTAAAFEQIKTLEPFDREYFAGHVGWQKPDGDGEWALTLRCARYDGDRTLRLYAGAGTVAGSDPDSEIRETATKMETFMRALA